MVHAAVYVLIPVLLVCLRKYRVFKWGRCHDTSSLEGKVFLVTGANSGIGLETVRELARRRARVIMACRDMDSARDAVEHIRSSITAGELIPMHLDLASLQSVRKFSELVEKDFPEIHVLINNAGVFFPLKEEKKTKDGFEIHFGVNHLGHFLLTNLLMQKLKDSAPSRVVVVSSSLYEGSVNKFDPTDVPAGYASSKLANVLFSKELAVRTQEHGIRVYTVCPGFTYTRLFRSRTLKWYHYLLLAPVALVFMRTAAQGAQTVLYCATSEEISKETGFIYKDCQHYKPKKILEPEFGEKLWKASEKLIEHSPVQ